MHIFNLPTERVYEFTDIDEARRFAAMFGGRFPFGLAQAFRVYTVII